MTGRSLLTMALVATFSVPARGAEGEPSPSGESHTKPEVEPWMRPAEVRDVTKVDYGGYLFVPELHLPIFLTDPSNLQARGVTGARFVGWGLDWRLGIVFGRLSVEALAGVGEVTSNVAVDDGGKRVKPAVQRVSVGAQSRYYFTNATVLTPFVGAGLRATRFSADAVVRSNGALEEVEGTWGASAHALLGVLVRIARPSSLFLQAGVRPEVHAPNGMFDEPQWVVSPYVALTTMGVSGVKADQ